MRVRPGRAAIAHGGEPLPASPPMCRRLCCCCFRIVSRKLREISPVARAAIRAWCSGNRLLLLLLLLLLPLLLTVLPLGWRLVMLMWAGTGTSRRACRPSWVGTGVGVYGVRAAGPLRRWS